MEKIIQYVFIKHITNWIEIKYIQSIILLNFILIRTFKKLQDIIVRKKRNNYDISIIIIIRCRKSYAINSWPYYFGWIIIIDHRSYII